MCARFSLIVLISCAALAGQAGWQDNLSAGKQLLTQGNYREAEARLLAAVRQSPEDGSAANELCTLYQLRGDYLQAERFCLRAEKTWNVAHAEDKAGGVLILNNLTAMYLSSIQLSKAERAYERARSLAGQAPNLRPRESARMFENLGAIYCARHKYEEALAAYRQAVTVWETDPAPAPLDISVVLYDLGVIYTHMRRWPDAISHLEQSVAKWKNAAGFESGLIMQLSALGSAYTSAGRLSSAEQTFEEAISIVNRLPEPTEYWVPDLFSVYAALLRKSHRIPEAKRLEARAEAIRRETGSEHLSNYSVDVGDLLRARR